MIEIGNYTRQHFDIFKDYNVDQYLTSFCLGVNSDYRNRGIAMEVLKARKSILKTFGLSVTYACFSVIGAQRAAEKAGYEVIYEMSYEEMERINPRFDFSKYPTKTCKEMVMKI
jgi:GNAT superfamily N-acetyltransferase